MPGHDALMPERDVDSNLLLTAGFQHTSSIPITTSNRKATWSSFFTTIFDAPVATSSPPSHKSRNHGWMSSLKKAITAGSSSSSTSSISIGSIRRLHGRILGMTSGTTNDVYSSSSEVWLLGLCYRIGEALPPDESSSSALQNGQVGFQQDFSSRIWITYRKGFDVIGGSKYRSDVNWGCMIRSSQMLIAQALVSHYLGRSWRRSLHKPYDPKYIEILNRFGDSKGCVFSIHNLLLAGKGYGLAAGSWVGPYAMCRSWEVLTHTSRQKEELPMAVYIVSGDEDGERGGAPVVHIDIASKLCSQFLNDDNCEPEPTVVPILLLVPLVLGLNRINLRYTPLLRETFTFPQSLGILGGKPGVSTYIIGVQDDKVLYLDPHVVQQAVAISRDNLEAATSSYHCSTPRHLPIEQIDPSLAIGFYCRDKDDFDDFCGRATKLAERSDGAPLFTVAQSPQKACHYHHQSDDGFNNGTKENMNQQQDEDDWQIL